MGWCLGEYEMASPESMHRLRTNGEGTSRGNWQTGITIFTWKIVTKWRVCVCVFQKTTPFYFYNNFVVREPISIIFGSNMPEEICNKTYTVLYLQNTYFVCSYSSL